jgi:hypothetical protein
MNMKKMKLFGILGIILILLTSNLIIGSSASEPKKQSFLEEYPDLIPEFEFTIEPRPPWGFFAILRIYIRNIGDVGVLLEDGSEICKIIRESKRLGTHEYIGDVRDGDQFLDVGDRYLLSLGFAGNYVTSFLGNKYTAIVDPDNIVDEGPYGGEDNNVAIKRIPGNRAVNRPFFNFLESHPNQFPILQKLIQQLGFGL